MPSYAQWEEVKGFFGPKINDIYAHQNVLLVAGDSGLVYSKDKGMNWNVVTKGLKYTTKTNALASIGQKVFAASDSGIYSSVDYNNWVKIFEYKSNKLVATKSQLLSNVIYGRDPAIITSKDTGKSWSVIELSISPLLAAAADSNRFLLGFNNYEGLHKYNGTTWNKIPYFSPPTQTINAVIHEIALSKRYAATVYQKDADKFAFSQDSGYSWTSYPFPLSSDFDNYHLKIIDTNVVFAGRSGIYITYDKGENWTNILLQYDSTSSATAIEVVGEYLYAAVKPINGFAKLYRRKILNFQGITFNGSGNLQAPLIPAATYKWYLGNEQIMDANKNTYTAVKNGIYKVVITYGTPNARTTAIKTVSYTYKYNELITSTTESADQENIMVSYYNQVINISGTTSTNNFYTIISSTGKEMQSGTIGKELSISTEKLTKGLYIVKVLGEKEVYTLKFMN